jgi:hypothetical protein
LESVLRKTERRTESNGVLRNKQPGSATTQRAELERVCATSRFGKQQRSSLRKRDRQTTRSVTIPAPWRRRCARRSTQSVQGTDRAAPARTTVTDKRDRHKRTGEICAALITSWGRHRHSLESGEQGLRRHKCEVHADGVPRDRHRVSALRSKTPSLKRAGPPRCNEPNDCTARHAVRKLKCGGEQGGVLHWSSHHPRHLISLACAQPFLRQITTGTQRVAYVLMWEPPIPST